MAFANLSPDAAIWRARGLRYILAPENAIRAACEKAVAARPASRPASARPAPPAWIPKREEPRETVAPAARNEAVLRPIPVNEWPEAWRDLFAKTKKGKIAWTYRRLGADLIAANRRDDADFGPRSKRGQFLRRVLGALRHPGGTHTFWPAQLDAEEPDPEIYWSGLKALGCRGAIVMGESYAKALTASPLASQYALISWRNLRILVLPGIDDFPEARYEVALDIIKKFSRPMAMPGATL